MNRFLSTIVCASFIALVGCQKQAPTPPAVKQALAALKSPIAKHRWEAAKTLGKLGPKAIAAGARLCKALDDPHWLVRAHAATALPLLGDAVIPQVLKHLHTRNISYRQGGDAPLARVVRAMQKKLLPHLLKRVQKHHGSARSWALAALTLLGPKALPLFHQLMQSKENALRAAVARAYPALGAYAPQGIPTLVRALDDDASYVRKLAAASLATIGTKDTKIHARMGTLLQKDSDVRVKIKAAEALARWQVTSAGAVKQLLDVLEAPTALSYFHFQLLRPLGQLTQRLGQKDPQLTKRAVKLLVGLLQHRLASMRFRAIEALAAIGPAAKSAVPGLISMLGSKPHMRSLILRTLGRLIDAPLLRQLSFHKDTRYRTLAAMLLKHHLTQAAAQKQIEHLLRDPNHRVRQQMLRAIRAPYAAAKQSWSKGQSAARSRLPRPTLAQRQRLARWLSPLATEARPGANKTQERTRAQALLGLFALSPLASPTQARPNPRPTTQQATSRQAPTSRPASQPGKKNPPPGSRPAPPQKPALGSPAWWDALLRKSLQGPAVIQVAAARGIRDLKHCTSASWKALEVAVIGTNKPRPLAALLRAVTVCPSKALSSRGYKTILRHTQHEKSDVRVAACGALRARWARVGRAGRARALLKLLSILRTDNSPEAAAAAATSLGALAKHLGSQEKVSLSTLLKVAKGLLHNKSQALRLRGLALVEALPTKRQSSLVQKLLQILQRDPHAPARASAARILTGHRGVVSEALWGQALYDLNGTVRLQALAALKKLVPQIEQAIPGLIALVWGQELQTESRAIALLGRVRAKRAAAAIASRLQANAWITRAHAARALGQVGPDAAQRAALLRARQDPHPQVRQAAAQALAAQP